MSPEELRTELETIMFYWQCEISLVMVDNDKPIFSICYVYNHYHITNLNTNQSTVCKNIDEAIFLINGTMKFEPTT